MTTLQHDTNRQAGQLRPGGFFGWKPGDRMRLAMKAGAFSAGGFAAMWGLRIVTQLLVAKKIGAGPYGQVGLVTTVIAGLMLLSDFGLAPNIVRSKRGDDPEFLNTAFTMNALRSTALWLFAAVLAYPVARFYHDSELTLMLVVAAGAMFIRGFASPAVWTLTRHVQVHKLTFLNVGSEVVGFAVALAWVHYDPSAWALIAGTVGSAVAFTLGSFLLGQAPAFRWSKTAVHELISFGVWLFLSTATYFAASQAERLALGKFITPQELGCFTMAVTMASAPTRAIQQLFEQVFFPLISRLCREDPARSILQFRRVKLIATGLAVAAAAVCILGGPFAVRKLLTPEFQSAGWMLQLLGFRAALDIIVGPTVNMLFASGESKFAATGNLLRLAVMIVGLWVSLRYYSLREAVWVLALAPLAGYLTSLHAIHRHVRAAFRLEWLSMVALLLATAIFAVVYQRLF